MIDIQELELEFNSFYGDKENEHTLLARMFPLIAEVKRLRGILGDIIAIDEWGGDGKDIGITITYGDGYRFSGWIDKDHTYCVDEEGKVIE